MSASESDDESQQSHRTGPIASVCDNFSAPSADDHDQEKSFEEEEEQNQQQQQPRPSSWQPPPSAFTISVSREEWAEYVEPAATEFDKTRDTPKCQTRLSPKSTWADFLLRKKAALNVPGCSLTDLSEHSELLCQNEQSCLFSRHREVFQHSLQCLLSDLRYHSLLRRSRCVHIIFYFE